MNRHSLVWRLLRHTWAPVGLLGGCILVSLAVRSEDATGHGPTYGTPRRIAELKNPDISESSGLAASRLQPGVFWTHNDSGDSPRIFAFDSSGNDLGACRLRGAKSVDWEDMASFERDGVSWLLLADIGNNGKRRNTYQLYLCQEPKPGMAEARAMKVEFRYETEPRDCESVAVDVQRGTVLLIAKSLGIRSEVFEFALPTLKTKEILVARPIATISVGIAVAMDISPDGQRAMVLTYGDAFEFSRTAGEDWAQGFSRPPRRISMPLRRQGESLCYGLDGRSLFLTSERRPVPLWVVPRSEDAAEDAPSQ